jgi:hypothetical protein
VGDQEGDLHVGGTVFIPANTWVDVKNVARETASVVFVFSAPGFENYMRCDSVLPTEKVKPFSIEEQRACSHARRARHLQGPRRQSQKVKACPAH